MQKIFTVSQVTTYIKQLIEGESELQNIWISGEISNFTRHSSGHMYFTLKDERARLRAVMFKRETQRLPFQPHDGLEVLANGRIAVYPKNGEYQLYVERLEASGWGALYLAFEQLKNRLAQEGLFDLARKKPLPALPRKIGVITSATGAAVHDIIRILHRRNPRVDVLIIPAQVQGELAPQSLVAAIKQAGHFEELDLVIIGRGGGSVEELWAFNDEGVARALAACPHPVISGIGHETDFTIADFVADLRAPTPSGAAELAVPELNELRKQVNRSAATLKAALLHLCQRKAAQLTQLTSRMALKRPDHFLLPRRQQLDEAKEDLLRSFQNLLAQKRQFLLLKAGKLDALSPLSTLARGYSLTFKETDGSLLRTAAAVNAGEKVKIVLHQGQLFCRVEETKGE